MLKKIGNAEILDIVDPEDIANDDKRKDALALALENSKKRLSDNKTAQESVVEN